MKFLSIKEFFYKLNTIGFILLLAPLSVFIFLYYRPGKFEPLIVEEGEVYTLMAGCVLGFFLTLTGVYWLRKAKIKKLKAEIELARKMDGYAALFLARMTLYAACSLALALAYFLTGIQFFTIQFILMVLITFIQWPMRSTFSRLLELNANERQMIMTDGDIIQRKNKRR